MLATVGACYVWCCAGFCLGWIGCLLVSHVLERPPHLPGAACMGCEVARLVHACDGDVWEYDDYTWAKMVVCARELRDLAKQRRLKVE